MKRVIFWQWCEENGVDEDLLKEEAEQEAGESLLAEFDKDEPSLLFSDFVADSFSLDEILAIIVTNVGSMLGSSISNGGEYVNGGNVGCSLGINVEYSLGIQVDSIDGILLGIIVGFDVVDLPSDCWFGASEGRLVTSDSVGFKVGSFVGVMVGSLVG